MELYNAFFVFFDIAFFTMKLLLRTLKSRVLTPILLLISSLVCRPFSGQHPNIWTLRHVSLVMLYFTGFLLITIVLVFEILIFILTVSSSWYQTFTFYCRCSALLATIIMPSEKCKSVNYTCACCNFSRWNFPTLVRYLMSSINEMNNRGLKLHPCLHPSVSQIPLICYY